MIRTIEQLINKFYLFFTYLCLLSHDLFDRATCLIHDDGSLPRIGSGGDQQSISAAGQRPLFALLGCAVMQTVFSLGDLGRPVSRIGSARYSSAFSWGHNHDQPVGRHSPPVRRGRAVL